MQTTDLETTTKTSITRGQPFKELLLTYIWYTAYFCRSNRLCPRKKMLLINDTFRPKLMTSTKSIIATLKLLQDVCTYVYFRLEPSGWMTNFRKFWKKCTFLWMFCGCYVVDNFFWSITNVNLDFSHRHWVHKKSKYTTVILRTLHHFIVYG